MKKASDLEFRILATARHTLSEPRKRPVQARSTATVDAILEATIQVLLQMGKEQLTTTRVAVRAGVSVGTLYQYFPNKRSLLQAVLQRHLEGVTEAVERICSQQKGQPLEDMAAALVGAFLEAKMRNVQTSVALYSVSSDVDAMRIVKRTAARFNKAISDLLTTASEPLATDPELVASILQGAMAGVSRRLLESDHPARNLDSFRQELVLFVGAYLRESARLAWASKSAHP